MLFAVLCGKMTLKLKINGFLGFRDLRKSAGPRENTQNRYSNVQFRTSVVLCPRKDKSLGDTDYQSSLGLFV